ncbi:spermatogenesis-associated protein 31D1 isoform X1 [Oryctolagus cuniculus]|uniref:Uncharacterized protein n=2 Tax=Oryctolagus cuniculus TaxID=9986 RepID=G1TD64_RABIT|nr:spermatogenesis-associated protein 31D1 isoform X1 [Oryctolagus cuniculus]
MEQVLLFLKSHAEPWQSFSSVYLDAVPSCIFLIVMGLLLLYLCYLLLPTKHRSRTKRKRKGGTFTGWRSHKREVEERRKLSSILKSPLGHHHDSTPFRHMLCPEPSCEVCNRTTAEIQQLLSQGSLQHAALSQCFSPSSDSMIESSVSLTSDLLAIAPGDPIPPPVPEPSPSPCSTLSTNLDTSFEDLTSSSNLGDFLPPEPTPGLDFSFPGGHFPTQPLGILPPPPCPGQETDPVLQGEVTVTLGDSVCGLPTHEPKTKATQSPDMATSEIWPQGHTKHLHISNWAQGDAKQNNLGLHSSRPSIEIDPAVNLPGSLLLLSPDTLELLERQVRKRGDFLIHEEKEKTAGPFPKQHRPDVPLHSPGKMLESISVKHDLAVSLPFWSSEDKPQELQMIQQPVSPKMFEVHLQRKCIQLTWGQPALNHDFLYPAGLVSSGCSSTLIVFSSMQDSSTDQEPPAFPDPPPLSEPEIQAQPLLQAMPQPQPQILTEDQPQSFLLNLPPSPVPQCNSCGVHFLGLPNEAEALMPSEIQHLEHHLLTKKQESLWDIPSVVLLSQKDFCPPAPNLSLTSQSSKACIPICILSGDFSLHSEIREKLEHHLRKRLIQHRWGLPRRVQESLSLINPQTDIPETSESMGNKRRSGVCLFTGQKSTDAMDLEFRKPGNFYERTSEMLPLEKHVRKSQGPVLKSGLYDHLINDAKKSSDMSPWSVSERESHMVNLSGHSSRVSGMSVNQKQLENALKAHLSKKVMQINDSQIPMSVYNSWYSIKQPLPLPEKSYNQEEHKDLAQLVSLDSNINTSSEISFLCSSKLKTLEDHIKSFRKRIMWGLPKKILESIEIFKTKGNPSQCSCHSNFPSSSNFISEVDSQGRVSKPIRRSSRSSQGDKLETTVSGPSLDFTVPVTSPVCKERLREMRQIPCDISQEPVGNIQGFQDCRQHFLSCTNGIIDKAKQKPPKLTNRSRPMLPTRQDGDIPESYAKKESSTNRTERLQSKNMQNSEHFPTYIMYREIFKAKELCSPPSPRSKTLKTNEPKSSPVIGVTLEKTQTTLTTKHPPPTLSKPGDPELSDLKNRMLCELKLKLANRDCSQVHSHPTDMPLASENLKPKPVLTHTQGIYPGHTAPSQVLHVHIDNTRIRREQMQEPCVPVCAFWKDQDKNLPAASKTVSPPEPKPEELGGGDAGLGPSQPRRRIHAAQGRTLKDTLESKYSPSQPLKGQPPAESHFRKRMKHFLQWIWPSRRCERQNRFLEQGRSLSSEQSMGPGKNQATCIGNTEVQSVKPASGKVPGKKLGHDHGTGKTCHQVPLSTQVKFSKTEQQAELQMGAAPVQGHPFNHRVTSCKGTSTKSCRQEAAFAGQSYPARNTHMKHRDREPKKVVPFRDQLWCQRYPSAVSQREPVPHPSPTCRCQVGQVP